MPINVVRGFEFNIDMNILRKIEFIKEFQVVIKSGFNAKVLLLFIRLKKVAKLTQCFGS